MLQSPKLLDSNWGLWNPRSKVQWHEIAIYWKRFETSVFCTKTAHSHWFWIIVYFLMWYISAFIVVFWTDLRTRIIASFLALLHSFNLTILRLCLPVLHCVKVSKPIVGLLNAHNCMGSCMLVKLLPPRVIHHTVWPLVMFSVSNILYLYILYMLYYFLTFTGTFSRCTMRGCRSRPILVYNCILRSNSLLQYNEIHSLFVICSLHSVLQTMRSWIQFNLDFCITRAQLL